MLFRSVKAASIHHEQTPPVRTERQILPPVSPDKPEERQKTYDIGNVVNRHDHAISGATMAFRILDNMGMDPSDVAAVITAIGHHDDSTAFPVNAIAAALILADKTDVRRSRVRNKDMSTFDIHDRVNYSVERSEVLLDVESKTITLSLSINTEMCAVMDYFEIFLQRMLLCRRAAEQLGLSFRLEINGQLLDRKSVV